MILETAGAINSAIGLYNEHQSKFRRYWNRMARRNQRILVLGPGGSGKSTLGLVLSGKEPSLRYQESKGLEKPVAKDELAVQLIVAPGQLRRKAQVNLAFKQFNEHNGVGIVFVGAYGYHHFTTPRDDHKEMLRPGLTARERTKAVESWARDQRDLEVAYLRELKPLLLNASKPFWMMTVVTMQDLWWDKANAVRRFYQEGEYADEISELRDAFGENFVHEYWSMSLLIGNFRGPDGMPLRKTAAGYEERTKHAHQSQLLKDLHEFLVG